jgi:hypothetical protein
LREHVVGAVVPADFLHQPGVAFFGFGLGHGEMMSIGAPKENPF